MILYKIRSIKQIMFNKYANNLKTIISEALEKLKFAPISI